MNLEAAKKLSPAECNRTIAEALGWKASSDMDGWWESPNGLPFMGPPNYYEDLNALQAVLPQLTAKEAYTWKYHLLTPEDSTFAPASTRAIALAVVLSQRTK